MEAFVCIATGKRVFMLEGEVCMYTYTIKAEVRSGKESVLPSEIFVNSAPANDRYTTHNFLYTFFPPPTRPLSLSVFLLLFAQMLYKQMYAKPKERGRLYR